MMRIMGQSSSSFDALVALVDYLQDPKARKHELDELMHYRDDAVKERKSLEKAAGGKKKLEAADACLEQANVDAVNIVANARTKGEALTSAVRRECGDLESDKVRLDAFVVAYNEERTTFNVHMKEALDAVEVREKQVTKREAAVVSNRAGIRKEQDALKDKATRVQQVLEG